MLCNLKNILGRKILATDGEIGHVDEFYFDDLSWTVRYLVVKTGTWLFGKRVLISPVALKSIRWDSDSFGLDLTMDQIRNSPDIDTDKPVSRQQEQWLFDHYAWPAYWVGGLGGTFTGAPAGYGLTPISMLPGAELNAAVSDSDGQYHDDPHLRSTHEVIGYTLTARDGDGGTVDDFVIDDLNWSIRAIVVDLGVWLPGKKVALAPNMVEFIDQDVDRINVRLIKREVEGSPSFDGSKPIPEGYVEMVEGYCKGLTAPFRTSLL